MRAALFPTPGAEATVVLMTGWSEFIEKYFEAVARIQERGFNVAMMDWRGQGLSDRNSPAAAKWVGYFDMLKDDLRAFAEAQVRPRFGPRMMLMTHSMGGMPALRLLADGYGGFECAMLCAPMTRLYKGATNAVVGAAATAACWFGLAGAPARPQGDADAAVFEGNIYTSDPARHARFRALQLAEPKAAIGSPSYGWLRAAMKASAELHAPGYFDGLKTPVRIVTAGLEQRVDGDDHAVIAARSEQIYRIVIPGALHEIMMERDEIQDLYWQAFDDFSAPLRG